MTEAVPAAVPPGAFPARGRLAAYVALTKPRIIELLLVTTVPVMVLAARGWPSGWTLLATLVGGTLAAGSANTINCVVDRDIDAVMARTKRRPMVRAQISMVAALRFGVLLGMAATALLGLAVNWPSAAARTVSASRLALAVAVLSFSRATASRSCASSLARTGRCASRDAIVASASFNS